KWIYFMKTARTLRSVPEELGNVPELRKAFTIANEANLDPDELEDLERREIFIQDQRGAITKATRIGREQGIEQGIKQGKLELVVRLLERRVGSLSSEIQTRIAQLSAQQLENLGEAVLELASVSDLTTWLQAHNNRQ
ncbi:DUF4351 domain-containing protein, partial [Microcoleus sp. Pol12B4]|uniref:DUF4351 domain-containing protein n=1 Tax=Microcoleus sp. Pol12B4 TaxID=3055395 RepID=UPI002FD03EE1